MGCTGSKKQEVVADAPQKPPKKKKKKAKKKDPDEDLELPETKYHTDMGVRPPPSHSHDHCNTTHGHATEIIRSPYNIPQGQEYHQSQVQNELDAI